MGRPTAANSVELAYSDPPPLFLGSIPLTPAVQVICFLHALVCVFVIATASSVVSFNLGQLEVSPTIQCLLSAWCVLGIVCIVGCLIGCRNRQEMPVRAYFYYCLASVIGLCVLLGYVIEEGYECKGNQRQFQRNGKSLTCSMVSAALFFAVLAILAIVGYVTYTVYQLKEYLWQREQSEDLLQYEDPMVKKMRSSATGETDSIYGSAGGQRFGGHLSQSGATPTPGLQPAWGSVPINSTSQY